MKKLLAIAAILSAPTVASSATLVTSGGILTGAKGVDVSGTLYDVQFFDTRCMDAFSGCNANSDFDFANVGQATAAASALLVQVFVNVPSGGQFDSNPTLTFGCTTTTSNRCIAYIPYAVLPTSVSAVGADNYGSPLDFFDAPLGNGIDAHGSFANVPGAVLAKFTVSAIPAVPEPASWIMLIGGFAVVGIQMRRRRTTVNFG